MVEAAFQFGVADDCKCCVPFGTGDFDNLDDWTQEAGSWSTSGGVLTTSSTLAALIHNTDAPNEKVMIKTDIKLGTTGDQGRAIIGFTDTANYLFAQVTVGTSGKLELYSRSGSVDTKERECPAETTPGEWYRLIVCHDGTRFRAALTNLDGTETVQEMAQSVTMPAGRGVGVGTGGTLASAANFDNFIGTNEASTDPGCDPCDELGPGATTDGCGCYPCTPCQKPCTLPDALDFSYDQLWDWDCITANQACTGLPKAYTNIEFDRVEITTGTGGHLCEAFYKQDIGFECDNGNGGRIAEYIEINVWRETRSAFTNARGIAVRIHWDDGCETKWDETEATTDDEWDCPNLNEEVGGNTAQDCGCQSRLLRPDPIPDERSIGTVSVSA